MGGKRVASGLGPVDDDVHDEHGDDLVQAEAADPVGDDRTDDHEAGSAGQGS